MVWYKLVVRRFRFPSTFEERGRYSRHFCFVVRTGLLRYVGRGVRFGLYVELLFANIGPVQTLRVNLMRSFM